MACDIKLQLIENIKVVFRIQLDESVDCAKLSQLMVFVHYIYNQTIEEDFLFCHPLKTTTKASNVQKLLEKFLQKEIWLRLNLEVFALMRHLLCLGCSLVFDSHQTEKL